MPGVTPDWVESMQYQKDLMLNRERDPSWAAGGGGQGFGADSAPKEAGGGAEEEPGEEYE
jgi:hypothetical protein